MRILIVNVNTTESMTAGIGEQASRVAAPGTEIVALTPRFGAESVEGNLESYLAAVAVMDRVLAYDQPYDAVIQAGYGEHGREGLQELLDVPVVDITEAAASTAMYLGHRYSVVTTLDRAVPLIEDRLLLAGLDRRCASVRSSGMAVLELESDPERAIAAIVREAEAAVRDDHAEVICLGCGGMAELEAQVRKRDRRTRGGWRRGSRDGGRVARPPGPVHVEGADVRATPAEEDDGLADHSLSTVSRGRGSSSDPRCRLTKSAYTPGSGGPAASIRRASSHSSFGASSSKAMPSGSRKFRW